MWQGVVPVDSSYDPIVMESVPAKKQLQTFNDPNLHHPPWPYFVLSGQNYPTTVLNAGPGTIKVRGWSSTPDDFDSKADIELEVRPGQSRTVIAGFIRVKLLAQQPGVAGRNDYAAVAWRIN